MTFYYANNPGWGWYVYTWRGTRISFERFLYSNSKHKEVPMRCVRNLLSKNDWDHLHNCGWKIFTPRGMNK